MVEDRLRAQGAFSLSNSLNPKAAAVFRIKRLLGCPLAFPLGFSFCLCLCFCLCFCFSNYPLTNLPIYQISFAPPLPLFLCVEGLAFAFAFAFVFQLPTYQL